LDKSTNPTLLLLDMTAIPATLAISIGSIIITSRRPGHGVMA